MDKVPKDVRSRNMAAIRSKDTTPEILFRKALFREGYRYRLHSKVGNVRPDIVFGRNRAALFVHGCFWHGHGCKNDHIPKSNKIFWKSKIASNKKRDKKNIKELRSKGWIPIVVWECRIKKGPTRLVERLVKLKIIDQKENRK